MSLGFGLLLAFVYLFLKKVWDDEVDNLKQQTNLLLVNAVRSIERSAFDRLIVQTMDLRRDSLHLNLQMRDGFFRDSLTERRIGPNDSMQLEYRRIELNDTTQVFKTATTGQRVLLEPGGTVGSLSMIVSIPGDSAPQIFDKSLREHRVQDVFPVLEKKFAETVTQAGTPIQAHLVRLNKDSTTSGLLAATYSDAFSDDRFGVFLDGYQKNVLRAMWPQLLFSALLLLFVALAFLFIYQSLVRQSRLTELKNDFIRNMTHELKTPIATVSVAVEALQHFDALQNPQRTQEYLEIAGIELNRLSLLVDKVLRVSMFEKQAPELRREPLDLQLLVQEILHSMRLQFEKYGAQVHFQPKTGDYSISGDRLHLSSVVYNLLDNALKYGTEHPEIRVGMSERDGQVSLQVQDNGIGIPATFQGRIFEKFFRVPTGDVHNVKGHGLGLSYVAGVVRLHGGSIGVESRERAGTTFTIQLPVEKPATG
jgi:signal transduction histidine kinase